MSSKEVSMLAVQNLDVLGYWDGTPEYKHYPPKDELVETVRLFFSPSFV